MAQPDSLYEKIEVQFPDNTMESIPYSVVFQMGDEYTGKLAGLVWS